MEALDRKWGLRFDDCGLGVSARRLCEHIELGQINPFAPISSASAHQPQAYLDVVDCSGPVQTLTGYTLADLHTREHPGVPRSCVEELLGHSV
jgi:hypothetical protein